MFTGKKNPTSRVASYRKKKIYSEFLLLFWVMTSLSAREPEQGFYVWQHLWNENVISAVNAGSEPLFPVVAELSKKKRTLIKIPFDKLAPGVSDRITPVIRVRADLLESTELPREIAEIYRELVPSLTGTHRGLQLDLDCPEAKLAIYVRQLREIRKLLPDTELSVTALPCHLKHPEFRELIGLTAFYVIQAHGLAVPHRLSEPAELMNLKTALACIRQAESLRHPYRIALPTYAYRLSFDRETGEFRHLSAEGAPDRDPGLITKTIYADPQDIFTVFRTLAAAGPDSANTGIIWFRLPVSGDRLNWDRKTLKNIVEGRQKHVEISGKCIINKNGAYELHLTNHGVLEERKVVIALTWLTDKGDYRLFSGFREENNEPVPGILPDKITGMIPYSGETVLTGWFRPQDKRAPKLKVDLQ